MWIRTSVPNIVAMRYDQRTGAPCSGRAGLGKMPSPATDLQSTILSRRTRSPRLLCAPSTAGGLPEPAPTWSVKDAEKLYNIARLGPGLFPRERGWPRGRPPRPDARAGHRPLPARARPERPGHRFPLLLRFSRHPQGPHPAALRWSSAGPSPSTATRAATPASTRSRSTSSGTWSRRSSQFGAEHGVGLECGSKPELQAVLGPGGADRPSDRLQRLQGRGVHAPRPDGPAARPPGLHRAGAAGGARRRAPRGRRDGRRSRCWGCGSSWPRKGRAAGPRAAGSAPSSASAPPSCSGCSSGSRHAAAPDCLKLVHFHLGSQITDIRYIKAGLEEIGRYYVEIREMGFDLTDVDVGGGLGVDYDGSRSTRPGQHELHPPRVRRRRRLPARQHLPAERHADAEPDLRVGPGPHGAPLAAAGECHRRRGDDRDPVAGPPGRPAAAAGRAQGEPRVAHAGSGGGGRSTTPSFAKERLQELFASDAITLRDMADIEEYYLATLNAIAAMIGPDKAAYPEIVGHLEAALVDRYFCNFSVFQSLPDNWAIDQLFPIMPIHRLDEQPSRRGTLQDITCDSDGVIDRFAGGRRGKPCPRAPSLAGRGALHPRHLPHGGLPGDPGRPAQPLRRHQRRARAS